MELEQILAAAVRRGVDVNHLNLPTEDERVAHNLKIRLGLSDREIGETMECDRITACRRRSRYRAKVRAIQTAHSSRP